MHVARHKVVHLKKYACVSSCKASNFKNRLDKGLVEFVYDDGWRVVQRAVATKSLYGSGEKRYDTVIVSGGKQ